MLQPRYYQQDAFNHFFDYIESNHGRHPVIVIPTAGGKSFLQALIVQEVLRDPGTRICLITHRQELIKQNYIELTDYLANELLDVGIYSAGLKCRDTKNRILFAGIQSVCRRAWELGHFDLILIDEAHRIPHDTEGTYRYFLTDMVKINPKVIIAGLSATPYRMKTGLLCEGKDKLFDDICHNTTIPELIDPNHFRNRDKKQYLCKIISKNGVNKADLTDVHIRGGEYVQGEMENAFLADGLVEKAVKEIIEYTQDRKKVLIFTSGIAHCEAVAEMFIRFGQDARFVHSQNGAENNEQILQAHKKNEFKYLCNVDQMTEGYNDKAIDCIAMLRGTKSPGLYAQIAGRGLRMFPGKENCLFLDFGGNILLHGPIDRIEVRRNKKGKNELATAPSKECPNCHSVVHAAVAICPDCGFVFKKEEAGHDETASSADILSKWKKPEKIDVQMIIYSRHQKQGKPDSMRVSYVYNMDYNLSHNEYICIEHEGFAKKRALAWLAKRIKRPINTVDDALDMKDYFREPKQIIVDLNEKFPKIVGYIFDDNNKMKDIPESCLPTETKQDEETHYDDLSFDEKLANLI